MKWLILPLVVYALWRLLRLKPYDTITDEWLTDHYIRAGRQR